MIAKGMYRSIYHSIEFWWSWIMIMNEVSFCIQKTHTGQSAFQIGFLFCPFTKEGNIKIWYKYMKEKAGNIPLMKLHRLCGLIFVQLLSFKASGFWKNQKKYFPPSPLPESCHWQSWKCFWQSEQKERNSAPKKTETDGTHLETMSGRRYGHQSSKSLTTYKIVICQNNEQKVWQLTGRKVTWVNQIPNRSSLSSAVYAI